MFRVTWSGNLFFVFGNQKQGCIHILLTITISSCGHSDIHIQTELPFLLLPMEHR